MYICNDLCHNILYVMTGISKIWIILEAFFTAILLWLNIMCYKEKYKHRNHSLT